MNKLTSKYNTDKEITSIIRAGQQLLKNQNFMLARKLRKFGEGEIKLPQEETDNF